MEEKDCCKGEGEEESEAEVMVMEWNGRAVRDARTGRVIHSTKRGIEMG